MLKRWEDEASGVGPDPRRHRVMLIGLDACDPATVRRLAAEGRLPNIARFLEQASRCAVRNPFGLFVGATWASFATGTRPDRHGFYCWDMIDPESYAYRLRPGGMEQPCFWDCLGAAGRRVAILDVPHTRFTHPVNGIGIAEWGCHDRHYGFHAQPPGRTAEIARRFGMHPVFGIDPYAVRDFAPDDHAHRSALLRTAAEQKALFEGLLAGARAKARLAAGILAERDWDLFVCVFGESHAVGHQFWHLHDPRHPDFDPGLQRAVGGDPVAAVYAALDEAVGMLAAQAGPDCAVMLLLSHGMGAHHDGVHLLEEVLSRLDRAYGAPGSLGDAARRARQAAAEAADRVAARLGLPAPIRARFAMRFGVRPLAGPAERARRAFFLAPNNYVYGGIRFNLAGREAGGWVSPEEMEAITVRLEADLPALVNAATGRRAVRAVLRADRFHRRAPGDRMPDLFVDWDRSAPIEAVRSPRIGIVRAPYVGWRTGDHRPLGLLLARAPDLPCNRTFPRIAMEDLPASLCARLGVPLQGADGSAIPWLSGTASSRPAMAAAENGRHS